MEYAGAVRPKGRGAKGADTHQGAFKVTNHPLPTVPTEPLVRVQQDVSGLLLVVCLTLASALMSASPAVHLVRERASRAKLVQLVSGAPVLLFWVSNYIWDYIQYSVTAVGIIILVAVYHMPQYTGKRLLAVSELLGAFGFAGLPLTYLLQGAFTDEMLALQRLNTGYFLLGYLGFVATWIIDLILFFTQPGLLKSVNVWVKFLFRLLSPHFCFSKAVFDVGQTYKSALPFGPHETNPFAWVVWGSPMTHMAVQAVGYFTLTILLESGFFGTCFRFLRGLVAPPHSRTHTSRAGRGGRGNGPESVALLEAEEGHWHSTDQLNDIVPANEDEDVREEREAVQLGEKTATSQVLIDGVTKTYHNGPIAALRGPCDPQGVRAVRGLWLGVPRGECFGLLGVNGAGKTTTFSMLSGEVLPDAGDACVCGASVTNHLSRARQALGYCPQFESLLTLMTPTEILTLYARLRGVPVTAQTAVVEDLLIRLGLTTYANRLSGTLSGGNKRKLAVGVALVGEPPVTLCDEPSTGVDPGARRSMWMLLKSDIMSEGHSLVLTSHSMEECDALCDRLAIMVAGRAACLGSPQHLKARFGGGYLIDVRCEREGQVERVLSGLRSGPCPHIVCTAASDLTASHATLAMPREDALDALPAVFAWLESHRTQQPTPTTNRETLGDSGDTNKNRFSTDGNASATRGDSVRNAQEMPATQMATVTEVTVAAVSGAEQRSNINNSSNNRDDSRKQQQSLSTPFANTQSPTTLSEMGRVSPNSEVVGAAERFVVDYSVRQATLESVFLFMSAQALHGDSRV